MKWLSPTAKLIRSDWGQPLLPNYRSVISYARELRARKTNWSLRECVMEAYSLALEAANKNWRF